jgi:4'-phosphopantetheinyl transferase
VVLASASPVAAITLCDLDRPTVDLAQMRAVLSNDELVRADRFVYERDRNRFISARYWLRQSLAPYCDTPAEEMTFAFGSHGKPSVLRSEHIAFNLSHSNNWALLAICETGINQNSSPLSLGIDIEQGRPLHDANGMFAHCLCPRELDYLQSLKTFDLQLDLFFTIWARKEAALKAHGLGFSVAPKRFDSNIGTQHRWIAVPNQPLCFFVDLSEHLPKSVQSKSALASTDSMLTFHFSAPTAAFA